MNTTTQIYKPARSVGVAYALCIFLGMLQIHRFYLNRPGSAIIILILSLITVGTIGLLMVIVDLFLIPSMTREENNERGLLEEKASRLGAAIRNLNDISKTPDGKWGKKAGVAYLLMVTLFPSLYFAGHRFYLKQPLWTSLLWIALMWGGLAMYILNAGQFDVDDISLSMMIPSIMIFSVFAWWVTDIFRIPQMTREANAVAPPHTPNTSGE